MALAKMALAGQTGASHTLLCLLLACHCHINLLLTSPTVEPL